jgi:isopentenyl-diphosphate Delta-isomerase
MEEVILVNEKDEVIGRAEKLDAHERGMLHRAFSVFLFNNKNELLLQQRALHKYHSPGLWTNTCCSHPRPDEDIIDSAKRRCKEEMGIEVISLNNAFSFLYKVAFENGLIEHEFDHVLVGKHNVDPNVNSNEVANFKWISLNELKQDVALNGSFYTEWFKLCYEKAFSHYLQK